jgi:DNA repair protein RecO (recombination protein O)
VVARGARRAGRRNAVVQPFGRVLVGCSGRSALLTLTSCEAVSHRWLTGTALYAGMYMNEVLLLLLRDDDAHPRLFDGYERALDALALAMDPEPTLRRFERLLLKETGYEVSFSVADDGAQAISATGAYRYIPDFGFQRVSDPVDDRLIFSGATLLSIEADDFTEAHVRRAAKQIIRRALAPHLGDRPIHSRALYRRDGAS